MSKKFVFIRDDKSIAIGNPDSNVLAALTGSGGIVKSDKVEWEIAKHFITNDADSAACKADHVAFLAPHIGSAREVAVRAWVVGINRGGLSESEAYDVWFAFRNPVGCTSYQVVEDTALPTDRYFRSAWEWSD